MLAVLAAGPAAASAQCDAGSASGDVLCVFRSPRWAGEFASFSANGLLGGLTAGVAHRLKGGAFADGFVRGLLGGAITYAGKRIAAERFDGAGLIGRELAAAGASAVRNAGEGRPLFRRFLLPLGPVWLEIDRSAPNPVRARVDVAAVGWLAYGIAEPELELDAGASLSNGTFTFRTAGTLLDFGDGEPAAGVTNAGIIFLADVPAYGAAFARRAAAHERVHGLQEDQIAILWTDPAVRAAAARIGLPAAPQRYLVYNLSAELFGLLGGLVPRHRDRPWELESTFFAR
jgi:hypothetical protein